MKIIYQGAKRGQIRQYANTLQRLIETIPADIFLLACTELPLFLPYISATNKQLIDPTEILAKAAIDFALDL
ncbi:aspartate racemase [Suttonella ornithocola]|uniref:Aspartate racemase n=1 Tax=Suttonella ornithocola TaxID=279832 RepID=A0A380N0I3_9GAMM|nr:aspartate/glutamate racemase family protein [Suttonella ornithocola]SUO97257.1 aspartate racemase [Suttonella ornithocola]